MLRQALRNRAIVFSWIGLISTIVGSWLIPIINGWEWTPLSCYVTSLVFLYIGWQEGRASIQEEVLEYPIWSEE